MWEHAVNLTWEGYVVVDTKERRLKRLVAVALGNEKLRWGNKRWKLTGKPAAAHLPAGHPIDLKCGVRYGLVAAPAADSEVVESAKNDGRSQPRAAAGQTPDVDQQLVGLLGPQFVALRPRVWKELKLSGGQRKMLAKARETEIEAFRKLMTKLQGGEPQQLRKRIEDHRQQATKRLNETLAKVIDKAQQSRLRQIRLQQQGLFALGDPDIQERLKLTGKQRQAYVNIVRQLQRSIRSSQQQNQDDPRQWHQQMIKIHRERLEKIEELLTEDQKQRWSELVGKPVDLGPRQTNEE